MVSEINIKTSESVSFKFTWHHGIWASAQI